MYSGGKVKENFKLKLPITILWHLTSFSELEFNTQNNIQKFRPYLFCKTYGMLENSLPKIIFNRKLILFY